MAEKEEKELIKIKLGPQAKGGFWNSGGGYFVTEGEVVIADLNNSMVADALQQELIEAVDDDLTRAHERNEYDKEKDSDKVEQDVEQIEPEEETVEMKGDVEQIEPVTEIKEAVELIEPEEESD